MDIHTFNGKRRIGTTDVADFTDFQGIGHDPLYKRYASVGSLVDKVIEPAYADFLAVPDYDTATGEIRWYVDQWRETPVRLVDLPPESRARYEKIKEETLAHYKDQLDRLSGEDLQIMARTLRHISDDFIYCADGKVYAVAWGMTPENARLAAEGALVHGAPGYNPDSEESSSESTADGSAPGEEGGVPPGPPAEAAPVEAPVSRMVSVAFDSGAKGILKGASVVRKPAGSFLSREDIPLVDADKDFRFKGWDPDPEKTLLQSDITFNAVYKKKRKWWEWLIAGLVAALIALGILALCGVFKDCGGKDKESGVPQSEQTGGREDSTASNPDAINTAGQPGPSNSADNSDNSGNSANPANPANSDYPDYSDAPGSGPGVGQAPGQSGAGEAPRSGNTPGEGNNGNNGNRGTSGNGGSGGNKAGSGNGGSRSGSIEISEGSVTLPGGSVSFQGSGSNSSTGSVGSGASGASSPDYESIRRKIQRLKAEIKDLENQLPENKRR